MHLWEVSAPYRANLVGLFGFFDIPGCSIILLERHRFAWLVGLLLLCGIEEAVLEIFESRFDVADRLILQVYHVPEFFDQGCEILCLLHFLQEQQADARDAIRY